MKNNDTAPARKARPWRQEAYDDYIAIYDGTGTRVADVYATPTVAKDKDARAVARMIVAAPLVRTKSQDLYNAIIGYVFDIPDSELPEDLVAAFDAIEAAWHKADGTKPEKQ
jgi:hypothetical protein